MFLRISSLLISTWKTDVGDINDEKWEIGVSTKLVSRFYMSWQAVPCKFPEFRQITAERLSTVGLVGIRIAPAEKADLNRLAIRIDRYVNRLLHPLMINLHPSGRITDRLP